MAVQAETDGVLQGIDASPEHLRKGENLTRALTRMHLLRAQGDDNGADLIRRAVVGANIHLAESYVVRRYKNAASLYGLNRDDAYQEAVVGLFTAVEKFDPGKGYALSTYADHWMRHRIQRAQMKQNIVHIPLNRWYRVTPASLDAPISDDNTTTMLDNMKGDVPDPEEVGMERERTASERNLISLVNLLDDPDRSVIRLRFLHGMTLEQIGVSYGLSRERIRQYEVRGIQELRRMLHVSAPGKV